MPLVKNFFYAVAIGFLFALQGVNPDKDLLRQFVLILQSDIFWTFVKLGTLLLTAFECAFSGPASSSSVTDDLKDLWAGLKKVAAKYTPARFEAAGGVDLGPGFAEGTGEKSRFISPGHGGNGQSTHPFRDSERAVARRMWEGSEAFTIEDMSDVFFRAPSLCIQELVGMGLYQDIVAVCEENSRRLNLRAGSTGPGVGGERGTR
ncbi:hypothetical protein [Paraburkholderia humisilvae]|uniref:Uncharacterized protein n=1 Tax=Paraburkholderia humisilvae TaxID=627669 RepID=A0A6J5DIZ0_9BURK|nr:hypothetical protein [Paraburkholderia humisilvae]CAB3754078.1 hypothetical protein LMG29542_02241 [Paraburkholderia humisilvae]